MLTNAIKINEAVDGADQMLLWKVILKRELEEQSACATCRDPIIQITASIPQKK